MSSIPGLGRSPGGGHGDPPSILGREIPWTEEPGRLQPMGLQRVGHDWATEHVHKCLTDEEINTTLYCVSYETKR